MKYNHINIEEKWQKYWEEKKINKTEINKLKPKFYVLDMFPYPSGAGLHVGHPLGYIATDIISRYKRLKGFNVLHPMGFDSFGLPTEQYAIKTGQHPIITTEKNILRYIEQLKKIGLSYDWDRKITTSDPKYYKWTQWIFMELFNSWYNKESDKAESIENLYVKFEQNGTLGVKAACNDETPNFTAEEWKSYSETEKYKISLDYRLTYISDSVVNFCPALGMVLSNDEVKDGVSERGGYPVIQKKMKQWVMRITAYADRLINDLDLVDWSNSIKEQQKNWIGRSVGAIVKFELENNEDIKIEVFTTRLDTIYGVTFIAISNEHKLANKNNETNYFTGLYCINPINKNKIPIYVTDYVLNNYGCGAVMGVPSGDIRDYNFAKENNLPIIQILDKQNSNFADSTKEGKYINSEIINGLEYNEAIEKLNFYIEKNNIGMAKVNYRLHDAIFSRQRYWGEPIPIFFKDNLPYLIDKDELPLMLPYTNDYNPSENGDSPLGRIDGWNYELNTMPSWAGSSWYWYRYMDVDNEKVFASKDIIDYWENIDVYMGGVEHATGHLLYSRFWNKFLKDKGYVKNEEFAIKLINQGMIMGRSNFVYRIKNTNTYVSYGLKDNYEITKLHVDINIVNNDILDLEKFKLSQNEEIKFILEDGVYKCGFEIEKMSKSKYNVVNPDSIIEKYGADTFRLYEMFLGPLTENKPWNTSNIEGCYRFINKLYRLFYDDNNSFLVKDLTPNNQELKIINKTIKKITYDIENYSFNTAISSFMICVNELTDIKCNKKEILSKLLILLSPFTPHICEELWSKINNNTIFNQSYPIYDEKYLIEDSFEYPIQINGKVKLKLKLPIKINEKEIEDILFKNNFVLKCINGSEIKKLIIVKNKIINIVI